MFCAFLSQGLRRVLGAFLVAELLCSSTLLEPRSNQVRRNLRHAEKKDLPQISVQFAHKLVGLVTFLQRIDVISKLFWPWVDINCQLSFARHARVLVQTCLSENRCQNLLVREWSPFGICHAILLTQPRRRILSSIVIGTPSSRCDSLFEDVSLFGSVSQFLLVIARGRRANLSWHASSGKSSFSAKLPCCPALEHKPERSAPCAVTLKTSHSSLEVNLRLPTLVHHVPRIPGCGNSRFPFCGEGHIPGHTAWAPRKVSLACRLSQTPFALTLIRFLVPQ